VSALSPFQGCSSAIREPRAYALGYYLSPLWGYVADATESLSPAALQHSGRSIVLETGRSDRPVGNSAVGRHPPGHAKDESP
jgi:hypothetical protein